MDNKLEITGPLEDFEDAKNMYRDDVVFHNFVNGLIKIMKDNVLTPEQIATGCALAVGEFEFHIEPKLKQNG